VSEAVEQREADQIAGVAPPETQPLVGHAETMATLTAAVAQGRPPAAVLLHGPRGIGKATFAFALARHVLAATGDEPEARVAAQIATMAHPNLTVLRRGRDLTSATPKFYSAIRVDEVRAAREALHRTRGRAGYRVCIIDAIDDCNPSSANALLKTLEEPPADTLFIVISHRPGGLLPTIRSRCQSIGMRPLSDAEVRAVLASGQVAADDAALDRATALAQGRPRRGFETLVLTEGELLDALLNWLRAPEAHQSRVHLALADALASGKGAELIFAQDLLRDWIADQARETARAGASRLQLASANALWEKANALFADADIYNLDRRQTLVAVFDALRDHARKTTPVS